MAWEDFDDALKKLGRVGPFQMRLFFGVVISSCFSIAWHMFSHVFTGAYPLYHCDVPIDYEKNETLDMYLPKICDENGICVLDQCQMFSNYSGDTSNGSVPVDCVNGIYYYPNQPFESTIVTQWGLFCGESIREATAYSVLGGGFVAGGLIFTTLSDYFGRKRVSLISQVLLGMVGLGQAFLPNYEAYCVFQFLRGMVMQGVFLTGVVLVSEMFPSNLRIIVGVLAQVTIAIGMMVLSGIAYGLRNHQHLMAAISAPFLLTFLLYWVIPESIPWLVITNKLEEAEYIITNAAKMNKREIPSNMIESLRRANDKNKDEKGNINNGPRDMDDFRYMDDITLCQACGSRRIVVNLCVLLIYWITMPLVYYGITLSAGNLAGDVYLNFFLLSVVELPSALACFLLLPKFGRKKTLFVCHALPTASLLVLLLLKFVGDPLMDTNVLEVVMAMLIKFGCGSAFLVAMFYTPEVFPTPIRNFCAGLCASVGTIVNIIVPFVILTGEIYVWLPYLIFFLCMLISGILVVFLPETLGRPLPQTVAELEAWNEGFCGGVKDGPVLIDEVEVQVEVNEGFQGDAIKKEKEISNETSIQADFSHNAVPNGKSTLGLQSPPNTRL